MVDAGGGGGADFGADLACDKIVVAGEGRWASVSSSDFLTARYNIDGTLDTSFGTGGWVMTDGYGLADSVRSVMMQDDPSCEGCQKIIVSGAFHTSPITSEAVAIRYNQ